MFGLPYKMYDVQLGITQPPFHQPLLFDKLTRRSSAMIAISAFNLLSYIVGVDAQLGKHCDTVMGGGLV